MNKHADEDNDNETSTFLTTSSCVIYVRYSIITSRSCKMFKMFIFRDGTNFEEHKTLTESGHPVSSLCVLPPSDGEQLHLIAVASSCDYCIRIYGTDRPKALYQLRGHTDTGNTMSR